MTVESEVANLTTSVDGLTAAVNVKKATLDASVAEATSQVALAAVEKNAAEAASAEAEGHKNLAFTYKEDAASAVAYQDLTAIVQSKAITAVDVFVYDTSRDSHGGAWRKRTQGTSWHNEPLNTATRGARREFPAVAVIVAEAAKVTIYDGDDLSLPMWMVFTSGAGGFLYTASNAVVMLNGLLVSGNNLSVSQADFSKDEYFFRNINGTKWNTNNLLNRNKTVGPYNTGAIPPIVNSKVNDVAMAVLPDAPIDPATGLPEPTIAVATDGGVSVIKDDGTVVDSASTVSMSRVAFNDEGALYYCTNPYFYELSFSESFPSDGFGMLIGRSLVGADLILRTETRNFSAQKNELVFSGVASTTGRVAGVQKFDLHPASRTKGMSALLTSKYNTGWLPGAIRGAFLADADDADLVGNAYLNDDFTGYADQAAAIAAGYSFVSSVTFSAANDAVVWSGLSEGQFQFDVAASVENGTPLIISATTSGATKGGLVFQDNFASVPRIDGGNIGTAAGTYNFSLIKVGSLRFASFGLFDGQIDNISVRLADADRSVNNKGLIVNGAITRTQVATGADLVAYSGLSASNYLEQPYNPDLDFGTGDFCVMGWVKQNGSAAGSIFDRAVPARTGAFFEFRTDTGGVLVFYTQDASSAGSFLVSSIGAISYGVWSHLSAIRRSGTLEMRVNGLLTTNTAALNSTVARNISNSSAGLNVGLRRDATNPFNGSLALIRVSATAPTADQIAKIYNDEKVLFQDGAQATLFGASDAVTALAHDPVTDLLHVGTSVGRSVFQGLRRVSNTTTPVGTAISAVNGMIAEE